MLRVILKAVFSAVLDYLKEQRLERDYRKALVENALFDERQRKAEAAKATTKAVLNEKPVEVDAIDDVRKRLLERAERNARTSG